MLTCEDLAKRAGLVCAVARDGSVWWVPPSKVEWYQNLETSLVDWKEPLCVDGTVGPKIAKHAVVLTARRK